MKFFYSLVLLSLLSCSKDSNEGSPSQNSTDNTEVALNETKTEPQFAAGAVVPRSGGCAFLKDDQIVTTIAGTTEGIIIGNLPGRTTSACYYRLDSREWSGDFVIDMLDGIDASNTIELIEKATPAEKLTIEGHAAQMLQGNRILRVAAGPPFELKLSILPKAGFNEYADETDRRRMLIALAQQLITRNQ